MPLTDAQLRAARPGARPKRLFDERGMYLEVQPSGGKYWRLKYRFGGREKRLALGVYPEVSLRDARKRRDEARVHLGNGVDPGELRRTQKASEAVASTNSFQAVANEWMARFKAAWAPGHASRVRRRFEADLYPWLGERGVCEITPTELLDVVRRIEARGALETAHRALRQSSQVFRFAVATGRSDRDPAADLRGALSPVREVRHFPAQTDPQRVGPMLRALWSYEGSPVVRAALRLAPLVFVRPGELRNAAWSEIDLDAAVWALPPERMKMRAPHIVPLARQAVQVLQELHPLTGHGRYVFPSARTDERPMSDNAVLAAMRRMDIAKDEATGHGFRAMARTILDEVLHFRPDIIEHQLAHAVRDPLGRSYNRTQFLPERRQMMQRWADFLEELIGE